MLTQDAHCLKIISVEILILTNKNKISGVIVLNYPAIRMKKERGCFSRLENILSLNNFKLRDAQLISNADHDFIEKIQIMLQTCQLEGVNCFSNAIYPLIYFQVRPVQTFLAPRLWLIFVWILSTLVLALVSSVINCKS